MKYVLILLISFAFGQDVIFNPNYSQDGDSYITPGLFQKGWQPNQKLHITGDGQHLFGKSKKQGEFRVKQLTKHTTDVHLTPGETLLVQLVTFGDFFDYAEECYADTIRLEKFGDEEYLLMHEYYGEVFTERQLEKQGYFYQYRWLTNTTIDENNPMKFEYIFVKEPTLKGFIEWLENRSNK